MADAQLKTSQISNFSLKTRYVALHAPQDGRTLSVTELEALRAEAPGLSASKHGLEVICGASCETGAQ